MDTLIPWQRLIEQVKPYDHSECQNGHKGGRPDYPLEIMLRIHMVQLFYNLSDDPSMEDALYEINSVSRVVGLNRFNEGIPDETCIMRFPHLLEKHRLGQKLFEQIKTQLTDKGLYFNESTIVDISIIEAFSSTKTKNKIKSRNPGMSSTRKGSQYYFGMKLHIGTDSGTGLIHSQHTMVANVHEIAIADKLLHGEEKSIHAYAGYLGMEKREEHKTRKVKWHMVLRHSQRKQLNEAGKKMEKTKASVRAKVEHPLPLPNGSLGITKCARKDWTRTPTDYIYW